MSSDSRPPAPLVPPGSPRPDQRPDLRPDGGGLPRLPGARPDLPGARPDLRPTTGGLPRLPGARPDLRADTGNLPRLPGARSDLRTDTGGLPRLPSNTGASGDTGPMPPLHQKVAVLLVEDDADYVLLVRHLFSRQAVNVELVVAYSAREALSRARARTFDLALVDHHLPDGEGTRVLARLREVRPHLPVVMITAHGDERLAVEVMKAGAYDYLRKDDVDAAGLSRLLRNVLQRALLEREVRDMNARLRDWAVRDGLTGLYNHRQFQARLREEVARAQRYGRQLSCLMLDLDHFKELNDAYGHRFGDAALESVATVLRDAVREVDLAARYGGEEFAVLLPDTDTEGAMIVAERIRARIAETPVVHDGEMAHLTISVGVATAAGNASPEVLVTAADAALFAAKRAGRNRVARLGQESTPPADAAGQPGVRARVLDGLTSLMDALAPESEALGERARRLALDLARAANLGTAEAEHLEAALGFAGLVSRLSAQRNPIAAAAAVLDSSGLLGRTSRLLARAADRFDVHGTDTPLAARIAGLALARVGALGAVLDDEALRAEAGRRFDPDLVARVIGNAPPVPSPGPRNLGG